MEPSLGLFGGRRGRIAIGLQARTAITHILDGKVRVCPRSRAQGGARVVTMHWRAVSIGALTRTIEHCTQLYDGLFGRSFPGVEHGSLNAIVATSGRVSATNPPVSCREARSRGAGTAKCFAGWWSPSRPALRRDRTAGVRTTSMHPGDPSSVGVGDQVVSEIFASHIDACLSRKPIIYRKRPILLLGGGVSVGKRTNVRVRALESRKDDRSIWSGVDEYRGGRASLERHGLARSRRRHIAPASGH
jgi:hypothetical protein